MGKKGVIAGIVILLLATGCASTPESTPDYQATISAAIAATMQPQAAPTATSVPTQTPVPTPTEEPQRGLILEDFNWEQGEFGSRYIVGIVVNESDRQYDYVQVSINLYDGSDVQVGSTFDNVNNLEPGGTWRFRALVFEDTATSAKVVELSGF